jgi:hypothetical protein
LLKIYQDINSDDIILNANLNDTDSVEDEKEEELITDDVVEEEKNSNFSDFIGLIFIVIMISGICYAISLLNKGTRKFR